MRVSTSALARSTRPDAMEPSRSRSGSPAASAATDQRRGCSRSAARCAADLRVGEPLRAAPAPFSKRAKRSTMPRSFFAAPPSSSTGASRRACRRTVCMRARRARRRRRRTDRGVLASTERRGPHHQRVSAFASVSASSTFRAPAPVNSASSARAAQRLALGLALGNRHRRLSNCDRSPRYASDARS